MVHENGSAPKPQFALDFFSGGVPPLGYLGMRIRDLKGIVSGPKSAGSYFAAELCIIGLAAYFEAFCKDQFAAIANIAPQTLLEFAATRECKIPVSNLLHVLSQVPHRLGFLMAEEYDFGSAKTINGLFCDLLKITPFSKSEIVLYSEFLNDRNLLVHHGGVYTSKYASQKFATLEIRDQVNFHSLVISKNDVEKWADFLYGIATKTAEASRSGLLSFTKTTGQYLNNAEVEAIDALVWDI